MGFEGFSAETLGFIADLSAHNDRDWFAANKARYERFVLEPEKAFVEAMRAPLAAIAPSATADPRVNGSIFRINRDTRFSRDKSPYKNHVDMWFWIGADRKTAPGGFFVRLTGDSIWIGGGAHAMSDAQVAAMRKAIAAEATGSELEGILGRLRTAGWEIGEQALKRVPTGFPADHPRGELLKYGSLHAMRVNLRVPQEFYSGAFVEWCVRQFAEAVPLVDWLAANT